MRTTAALACLVLFGCSKQEKNDVKPQAGLISAVYKSWNEEIRVDGKAMTLVHTKTEHEFDNPTSSVPSRSKVVKVVDAKVDAAQLAGLEKAIRDSGFLQLKDRYGAEEGQRYYPYSIRVELRDATKQVEHRSNPSFEGPPEAFDRVTQALRALSDSVRR